MIAYLLVYINTICNDKSQCFLRLHIKRNLFTKSLKCSIFRAPRNYLSWKLATKHTFEFKSWIEFVTLHFSIKKFSFLQLMSNILIQVILNQTKSSHANNSDAAL